MKKLFVLGFLLAAFSLAISTSASAQAGTRLVNTGVVNQGSFIDFGGVNLVPSDSLQVTDTIRYIIPVTHLNEVWPYYTWMWTKIGAGTATITQNFYQSNDGVNFVPIKAGVAQTTYTKSYTLSASTGATNPNEVSFTRDTARFEGRFLQVQFITSNTASVKGKIFNRVKFNIK